MVPRYPTGIPQIPKNCTHKHKGCRGRERTQPSQDIHQSLFPTFARISHPFLGSLLYQTAAFAWWGLFAPWVPSIHEEQLSHLLNGARYVKGIQAAPFLSPSLLFLFPSPPSSALLSLPLPLYRVSVGQALQRIYFGSWNSMAVAIKHLLTFPRGKKSEQHFLAGVWSVIQINSATFLRLSSRFLKGIKECNYQFTSASPILFQLSAIFVSPG